MKKKLYVLLILNLILGFVFIDSSFAYNQAEILSLNNSNFYSYKDSRGITNIRRISSNDVVIDKTFEDVYAIYVDLGTNTAYGFNKSSYLNVNIKNIGNNNINATIKGEDGIIRDETIYPNQSRVIKLDYYDLKSSHSQSGYSEKIKITLTCDNQESNRISAYVRAKYYLYN